MSLLRSARPAAVIEVDGVTVPARFSELANEVQAIRERVALSELAHVSCLRLSGEAAQGAVDHLCPIQLFLRDGELRQTLLLGEDGTTKCDLVLGCDDDGWLFVSEGMPTASLLSWIRDHVGPAEDLVVENLSQSHVVLSLNGPFAWELMVELEGPDVIGFPYLSLYHPRDGATYLRAGKTGEFGYDLVVPREQAPALVERIRNAGRAFDLELAGVAALWHCALENWFFNVHREGRAGLTPLELGLQWRVSYDKDYVGAAALRARRQAGAEARLTAVRTSEPLGPGCEVWAGDRSIGIVLHAERSVTIGDWIGVASLELAYAHSGITQYRARRRGAEAAAIALRTVSAPFVNNLSLYVNPQRHHYGERAQLGYPGADRERLGTRTKPVE